MIAVLRRVLPLMEPSARHRFVWASLATLGLAAFEAVALLDLAPLMLILTAPGLRSNSKIVHVVSGYFGNPPPGHLALELGVVAVALYATKDVLAIFITRWTITFCLDQETAMVHRLMQLYMNGPYRQHLQTNSAEFIRTLSSSVRILFGTGVVATFNALADLFSVIFVGAILFAANPWVAAAAFAYFGVVAFFYQRVLRRALADGVKRLHRQQAVDVQTIHQALTAIKEIKVRGREEYYIDEVTRIRRSMIPSYRTMALLGVTPRYVLELAMVGAATTIAALAYSTEPASSATATLGLFLAGGFRLLAPLNKVMFGLTQARAAAPAIDQIYSDLDSFSGSVIPATGTPTSTQTSSTDHSLLAKPAGDGPCEPGGLPARLDHNNALTDSSDPPVSLDPRISLRDVWYSYKPGVPVLRGISFDIEPGEAIGLVGNSGAGKSTLLDLLLGLFSPERGSITVGGHPMASVLRSWQNLIGYVPQNIALFDDTIMANIAFGIPSEDADEASVWRAAHLAQLDEVLTALPDGLSTRIGESGVRLSGGQRQRLGVARALYHHPSVLMFDEATSALDNETEFKLTSVLDNLRGEVTTVTIAHRLSTVRRCDRILYLEGGSLIAEGTFAELNAKMPGFARLVNLSDLRVDPHEDRENTTLGSSFRAIEKHPSPNS